MLSILTPLIWQLKYLLCDRIRQQLYEQVSAFQANDALALMYLDETEHRSHDTCVHSLVSESNL
jgi:hypothetical protein